MQEIVDHHRLEDIQLEKPAGTRNRDRDVVAHHLSRDHRQRLALRRIDLTGHDRRAGFVGRQRDLGESGAGSGSEETDVVGDLLQRHRDRLEGATGVDDGVMGAQRLEEVRCLHEGQAGHIRNLGHCKLGKSWISIETGTDRRAAKGELVEVGERGTHAGDALVDLLGPGRELIAEREGHRVHEMGPPDLDNLVEILGLRGEGVTEPRECGQEVVNDVFSGGDVHRGREGVVG